MNVINHTLASPAAHLSGFACVPLLALSVSPATAQFVNSSFELGGVGDDIPGWSVTVQPTFPVSRVSHPFFDPTLLPTDGEWMIELPDTAISSMNTVWLREGDRVLVDIAVRDYESGTFEMGAEIRREGTGEGSTFVLNASQWGGGWRTVELVAPISGDYVFTAGWIGSATTTALVYVDNVRVVPAPGSAALLATSTLLTARRRRRAFADRRS